MRVVRNSERGGNTREAGEGIDKQRGGERKNSEEPKIIKIFDSKCDQQHEDFMFTPP